MTLKFLCQCNLVGKAGGQLFRCKRDNKSKNQFMCLCQTQELSVLPSVAIGQERMPMIRHRRGSTYLVCLPPIENLLVNTGSESFDL